MARGREMTKSICVSRELGFVSIHLFFVSDCFYSCKEKRRYRRPHTSLIVGLIEL